MMFINFQTGKLISWHVGESVPLELRKEKVAYIQVDGDELVWIEETFLNIPKVTKRVVVYPSIFAELIFANMSFQ